MRFAGARVSDVANGAPQVRTSFDVSLKNLQTDYLDSLVLHSPLPTEKENLQVWRAMEDFHQQVSGCRIQGSGSRVQGSGFRVQGSGSGFRVRLGAHQVIHPQGYLAHKKQRPSRTLQ